MTAEIAQTPERRVMQDCLQSYIRAVRCCTKCKHLKGEKTQTRKAREAGPLADTLYKYQTGRSKIEM